jgi:hypothetical protein
MATWKKIIVSGSNAELNKLNVGTNQQISSSAGSTFLSGSFSGSFEGTLKSALANTTQPNIVGYDTTTGLFSYQGTGSFTAATASYVTASNVYGPYGASSVLSASFAVTAAFANNVPATSSYALQALSASFASTASSAYSATIATSASYVSGSNVVGTVASATSASYANNASTADSATTATTASYVAGTNVVGAVTTANTASYVLNAVSASFATNANTASFVLNAVSSSFATNASTASFVLNAVSASFATSALSASYAGVAGNANSIENAITNNTNNFLLTAPGAGSGSINGESNLTFDGSTLTVGGNANITGNLTVAGTASFYNQTTLEVADKFIILASGSTSLTDGGIIIAAGGTGQNISGSAFFLEATSTGDGGRFAIAANVHQSSSAVTADEFMVSAKISGSAPSVDPTWGGSGNGGGNIYINSSNGDIYIYS